MGMVFEEVIRRFNEETNVTDAGRHFTPRDVVQLMADLAFIPVQDIIKAKNDTYTIYDGACGTGGMLTVGEERILEIAEAGGKRASIHIFGQENFEETYAIARADMLLKGTTEQAAEQADNIKFGSTISNDKFRGKTFNFMLSNPPFGTPWKKELDSDEWGGIKKEEISDARFVINYDGGEYRMVPDVGDPQMLFLANNVSKMKKANGHISRIVEVHNGAALSTGKAGQGSTNLRRYIIENDLLEAIIALPESMFYNTPIGTFLWILTSKKPKERKGTVQLINATTFKKGLRKNIGDKNCEITESLRQKILDLYLAYDKADHEFSVILKNDDLGYWSVPILRPKCDENGKPLRDKKGKMIPDKTLTDTQIIPFSYEGGIQGYFETIVKPYVPNAEIDETGIKIGYEISFVKYFYQPEELRDTSEVLADIKAAKDKAVELLDNILSLATIARQSSDVKMKDSRSKWLGLIPAHWDLMYLSQICEEQSEKNKGMIESNVLSLSHGNIIRKKDLNYGLVPKDYDGYQIVEDGNIILRLTDLQNDHKSLRTALVRERGIITSAYTCLKTTQHPRYVQLMLHVYDLKKYFYGLGGGVRQSIGFYEIRNLLIPIPPIDEQIAIANFVDRKSAAVATAVAATIAKLKDEITLLGQYKNQMAADMITGKIAISEFTLPDVEPINDDEEETENDDD
jgi:type I restriction enzyme M protein